MFQSIKIHSDEEFDLIDDELGTFKIHTEKFFYEDLPDHLIDFYSSRNLPVASNLILLFVKYYAHCFYDSPRDWYKYYEDEDGAFASSKLNSYREEIEKLLLLE